MIDESGELLSFFNLLQRESEAAGSILEQTVPVPSSVQPPRPEEGFIEELRGFLQEKLPQYMVPASFVLLRALPLTPNGKIDRQALPGPDVRQSQPEAVYVPPQTEAERAIVAVLQEVLNLDRVSVHENFFNLGASSLHIVRAHSKLEKIFDRSIAISAIFEHPTVSDLAKYLSRAQRERLSVQESQERSQTRRAHMEQMQQLRERRKVAQ